MGMADPTLSVLLTATAEPSRVSAGQVLLLGQFPAGFATRNSPLPQGWRISFPRKMLFVPGADLLPGNIRNICTLSLWCRGKAKQGPGLQPALSLTLSHRPAGIKAFPGTSQLFSSSQSLQEGHKPVLVVPAARDGMCSETPRALHPHRGQG